MGPMLNPQQPNPMSFGGQPMGMSGPKMLMPAPQGGGGSGGLFQLPQGSQAQPAGGLSQPPPGGMPMGPTMQNPMGQQMRLAQMLRGRIGQS